MGQSITLVCQDWANTKAACRFFSKERVNGAAIPAAIFNRRGIEWGPFVLGNPTVFGAFHVAADYAVISDGD